MALAQSMRGLYAKIVPGQKSPQSTPKGQLTEENVKLTEENVKMKKRIMELEDELAAYKKTVTLDKAAYQRLAVKHQQSIEERDNAIVKYAISEAKLDSLDHDDILWSQTKCDKCSCAKLADLQAQVESLTSRLESRKEKPKLQRIGKRSSLCDIPPYNPVNTTPVPVNEDNPHFVLAPAYLHRGYNEDHVMKRSVLSELLFKDDQLVNELADSLQTTSIQGHHGDWRSLCQHLKINPTNLYHLDPRTRLLDILKEYQKSCPLDLNVRQLHGIFKQIGNENSADRLVREAHRQLSGEFHGFGDTEQSPTGNMGRYRHQSQYCSISQDQSNRDDDVQDDDIDDCCSEDCAHV